MKQEAYLLLGTNLGNRQALLDLAVHSLAEEAGEISAISSIYESMAWGKHDQPDYLNQVVKLTTPLTPLQLLKIINEIERKLGRERHQKWGPRLIDIDILLYGNRVVDHPQLQIPHPHLPNRRFALVPLQEIAPGVIHPAHQKTITELLACTPDPLGVRRFRTGK
ncbi:2-amino-4-hydroxy-6-hydroxymethyldihydropteridine diphosphokinase [Parapedobacter lycopersici]|uniref:2-amino-4-hydroxy-6- hydroxymethyldihydropteridine diphosphokinase n=1 Tax=Parapedobacter lycopersici TaxID=1864939 RepID=UPI00214D248E|nr:2-amino-4-hydroxy-6-hydroxymethyldihydropteridine diphosphokinase [Parapedobacter lycopersici]